MVKNKMSVKRVNYSQFPARGQKRIKEAVVPIIIGALGTVTKIYTVRL